MTATPHLDQLQLTATDKQALCRNGFVAAEQRGELVLYKLRFRVQGVQRVRSLGTCATYAAAIRLELSDWQAVRRVELESRRLAADVQRLLRDCKSKMQPIVAAAGYTFHGRAIRKPQRLAELSSPETRTTAIV